MTRAGARRSAVVLAIAGAAAAVGGAPVTDGPPAGFTGGFGEPSCVACHTGSEINAFGGRVTLEGLPRRWRPGEPYTLTVVLEAEGTEVAGFQLAARYADGARRGRTAGRLAAVDGAVTVVDSAGVWYAQQSADGARPASSDRATWTVEWRAPAAGDSVVLNVAANSGNGDNSPLSDLVYTHEVRVERGR